MTGASDGDGSRQVGVGPHPRPWPADERLDPELLRDGDRRIVGKRRWNRRGAMVTDRYLHVDHVADLPALAALARALDLVLVAIDVVPGAVAIETTELPERTLFLLGQEGPGLTPEALAAADIVCSIAQYGSTRSINVGVAAGIAMHAWIRQHAGAPPQPPA